MRKPCPHCGHNRTKHHQLRCLVCKRDCSVELGDQLFKENQQKVKERAKG